MGKKKAPKAPDMTTPAMQDTYANRPNQSNPWGSTSWETKSVIDPSTGKPMTQWNQNTTLNPQDQANLDAQRGLQGGLWGQAQQSMQNPMNWDNFQNVDMGGPQMGLGNAGDIQKQYDFSNLQDVQGSAEQRQRAEDAMYSRLQSRLDPQWQQREQQFEANLAGRGAGMSSAAERARMNQGMQRNDAYSGAALDAIIHGGQEMDRSFGMDMSNRQQGMQEAMAQGNFGNQAQQQLFNQMLQGGQFANQAQQQRFGQQTMTREQQIQEALRQRQQPMEDLRMMQGLGPQNPQFAGYGSGGGQADAVGQNYANQVNQVNAQNQQTSNMWGTLAGLGGMALFSDERLKEIGPRVGTHPRGVGLYLFRYLWEPVWRLGVIAQEVQQVAPELVGESQGFLTVNYEGL